MSLCLLWGTTVVLGPSIIGFALGRFFGEQQIRLTGLAISPKLQISASHAEFDYSKNGHYLRGSIRAPKIKISLTANGWLVKVSSGLLQFNDVINISSLKADFRTASITNIKVGQLYFTAPKFVLEESFEVSDLELSSGVRLPSSALHNLTFSGQTASILAAPNGDSAFFDAIAGRVAKISLLQDWQSQMLDLKVNSEMSRLNSDRYGKMHIQSILLEAKTVDHVLNANVVIDSLNMPESGLYFEDLKANPSIELVTWKFEKEMNVQIEKGQIERTAGNRVSGNLKGVDVALGLHLPERFLRGKSYVSDLEIWNDQLAIVSIPELAMDLTASISVIDKVQETGARLKVLINGENGPVLEGNLASQLFNLEAKDCLITSCILSDILFEFQYEFEGESVIGKGICPLGQCDDEKSSLVIETSNTPKIVMGLTKQKIINPIALVMFAGGIMQGQEVGLGHKIHF